MNRRGRLLLVVASLGLAAGCVSYELPPEVVAADDSGAVAVVPLSDVGVEDYTNPELSNALIDALRDSGLFHNVGRRSEMPTADLLARVVAEPPAVEALTFIA